jgi:ferrochelatase
MEKLPTEGVESVDVICPGFAADCLETIEEINEENREIFMHAGGKGFNYIAALNDREDHLHGLADLLIRHIGGWPESGALAHPDESELAGSLERALAMGAER